MSLDACVAKMEAEGLPAVAIETFAHYYRQLEAGETGMIAEAEIAPVENLPSSDTLPEPADGAREALGDWWVEHPQESAEAMALREMNLIWMGLGGLLRGEYWTPPAVASSA